MILLGFILLFFSYHAFNPEYADIGYNFIISSITVQTGIIFIWYTKVRNPKIKPPSRPISILDFKTRIKKMTKTSILFPLFITAPTFAFHHFIGFSEKNHYIILSGFVLIWYLSLRITIETYSTYKFKNI